MSVLPNYRTKLLALLAVGQFAGTGLAVAAPTLEYDCDTASGSFSELKQVGASASPVAISGSVIARQFRGDQRWFPVAAISVKSENGDFVMLRTAASEREKGPLSLQLLMSAGGKKSEEVLATSPVDEAVAFSIVPTGFGVRVTLGSASRDVPFDKSLPTATTVTCSTGEFLFTALKFGNE